MAAPVPEGSPLKVADEATSQAMQFGKKSFVKAVQQITETCSDEPRH